MNSLLDNGKIFNFFRALLHFVTLLIAVCCFMKNNINFLFWAIILHLIIDIIDKYITNLCILKLLEFINVQNNSIKTLLNKISEVALKIKEIEDSI